jgi:hypothetical protein
VDCFSPLVEVGTDVGAEKGGVVFVVAEDDTVGISGPEVAAALDAGGADGCVPFGVCAAAELKPSPISDTSCPSLE